MQSQRPESRYEYSFQTDQANHISEKQSPSSNFLLFRYLPPEIRVLIWTHALNSAISPRPPVIRQKPDPPYMAKDKAPALLHVAREARHEAAKFFTARTITFELPVNPDMILFFNPGVETVFLDTTPERRGAPLEDRDCYCRSGAWPLSLGCACPDASLPNRHIHLLRRFFRADTTAVKHVALHFDQQCGNWFLHSPFFIREAFPAAESYTFAVPSHQRPGFSATLSRTWARHRTVWLGWRSTNGWRVRFVWEGTTFKLWVKDEGVEGCWWKLKDELFRPFGCPWAYQIENLRKGTSLDVLLDGGL